MSINLDMFEKGASQALCNVSLSSGGKEVTVNKKIYQNLVKRNDEKAKEIDDLTAQVEYLEEKVNKLQAELDKHLPPIETYYDEIKETFKRKNPKEIISKYNDLYFKELPESARYDVANFLVELFSSLDLEVPVFWRKVISNGGVL